MGITQQTPPLFHPKGRASSDNSVIDECNEVPSIVGKEVKTKRGDLWRFIAAKGGRGALTVSQMVETYDEGAWPYILAFAVEHATGATICLPTEKEETPFPESNEARAAYMLERLSASDKDQIGATYVCPLTGHTIDGFYRGSTPTGYAIVVAHHRTKNATPAPYSSIVSVC